MLDKILCPVDFSAGSNAALKLAVRLAIAHGSELVLAHAWQYRSLANTGPVMATRMVQLAMDDERRGLDAAADHARKLGANCVTTQFLEGSPWHQLVELAETGGFDLVVMGTHGRTGLKRMFLGSVAANVVRHSPVSVLVVREHPLGARFDHVLCPIDFSAESPSIVERAVAFAAPDGELELLHVVELPLAASGDPMLAALISEVAEQATAESEILARDVEVRAGGLRVRSEVTTGDPTDRILAALEEDRTFDLVVVGTHGRTGLSRALVGSVTERLVRHAPCSMLVVRA